MIQGDLFGQAVPENSTLHETGVTGRRRCIICIVPRGEET